MAEGREHLKSESEIMLELLGADLVRRYHAIRLPLLLSFWLTREQFKNEAPSIRKNRAFSYDYSIPFGAQSLVKKLCFGLAAIPFGLYGYLRGMLQPNRRYTAEGCRDVLLSNTFLYNRRYIATREVVAKQYNCRGFYAACDGGELYPVKDFVRASVARDHGNCRPLFLFSDSLAGRKLKSAMWDWCVYLDACRKKECPFDVAEAERLLRRLEQTYTARRQIIKRKLQTQSIAAFFSINTYNLRDILIIDACRELGIRTIYQEHGALRFSPFAVSDEYRIPITIFAQVYACWSEEERAFLDRYFRLESAFGDDAAIDLRVSGNLELTYGEAQRLLAEYPVQRRITFMHTLQEGEMLATREKVETIRAWRWQIYKGLRALAEREKVAIRIRYKPSGGFTFEKGKAPDADYDFRGQEEPILRQWGFEISDSTPATLMEDICTSSAVISAVTSVMATALLLGRTVFRVRDPFAAGVPTDASVHDIEADEIAGIRLPEDFAPQLRTKEDFFALDRLL